MPPISTSSGRQPKGQAERLTVGSRWTRLRTAVVLPVPRGPTSSTPLRLGLMSASMRATFISRWATRARKGKGCGSVRPCFSGLGAWRMRCAETCSSSSMSELGPGMLGLPLAAGALAETVGLALLGGLPLLALVVGFEVQRRDGHRAALVVERDIDEVGGVGVGGLAGAQVLRGDNDTGFHGGAADEGKVGLEGDQIAKVNRLEEEHLVHGDGDDGTLGMADGGRGAGFVHELHDDAAMDV